MKGRPSRAVEVNIGPQFDQILQESADAISCIYRCALGESMNRTKVLELSTQFLRMLYEANEKGRLFGRQHSSLDRC